ncbi:MAG: hypothetical protein MUP70_05975 [Candidatus Aminicenantes bacterium]|nr:hypothetical protein [Candidatus Aminicenantes bacterium]
MTLRDIQAILEAEVILGQDQLDTPVDCAGGSDLMSDVLAFGTPGIVLLTGLSNAQSVRTADIIEAKAVIYVRGKKPDEIGIRLAEEKHIPLFSTKLMMYTACGLLYSRGLRGVKQG